MGDELRTGIRGAGRRRRVPPWRELLWRELLGHRFREIRKRQGRTLADVATEAGVSVQYLSEVERGKKEPSSEIIAAIAGALEVTLLELTSQVGEMLAARPAGHDLPAGHGLPATVSVGRPQYELAA